MSSGRSEAARPVAQPASKAGSGAVAGAEIRLVWTLTTWMLGDDPEGFDYGYPSRESAERNGRMFQEDERAERWQVVSPSGDIAHVWERRAGTPSEMGWVR